MASPHCQAGKASRRAWMIGRMLVYVIIASLLFSWGWLEKLEVSEPDPRDKMTLAEFMGPAAPPEWSSEQVELTDARPNADEHIYVLRGKRGNMKIVEAWIPVYAAGEDSGEVRVLLRTSKETHLKKIREVVRIEKRRGSEQAWRAAQQWLSNIPVRGFRSDVPEDVKNRFKRTELAPKVLVVVYRDPGNPLAALLIAMASALVLVAVTDLAVTTSRARAAAEGVFELVEG